MQGRCFLYVSYNHNGTNCVKTHSQPKQELIFASKNSDAKVEKLKLRQALARQT